MYCLNWDSYKNNICSGFAQLQQSEEFVDMTLVAEGHLVKVHKSLISLASPFIKNIIKSAPCEHPIIFLVNISHDILCYVLEYIYIGQVHVKIEKLDAFLNAAKQLQLPGIASDLLFPTNVKDVNVNQEVPAVQSIQVLENRLVSCATSNSAIQKVSGDDLDTNMALLENDNPPTEIDIENISDFLKFHDPQNSVEYRSNTQQIGEVVEETPHKISIEINHNALTPQQYTISKRGAIQMILNRYMYSMQYSAFNNMKRRWRCIDYRNHHCGAYVDTHGDKITKRKNIHSHLFHDWQIMKKSKSKLIFGSINAAMQLQNNKKRDKINEMIIETESGE